MNDATEYLCVSASSGLRHELCVANKPCHTNVRSGHTRYKNPIGEPDNQTIRNPICYCPDISVMKQWTFRNRNYCSQSIPQSNDQEDIEGSPTRFVNAFGKYNGHHSATGVRAISMSGPCPHTHEDQKTVWQVSKFFPQDFSKNARMSDTVPL